MAVEKFKVGGRELHTFTPGPQLYAWPGKGNPLIVLKHRSFSSSKNYTPVSAFPGCG